MLYAENIGDDTTSNLSDSYILLTFLESPESNISLNLHYLIDKEDTYHGLMVLFMEPQLYQSGSNKKRNKLGLSSSKQKMSTACLPTSDNLQGRQPPWKTTFTED